jgi:predicted small secreted protein
MNQFLIGLGIGVALALIVLIGMASKTHKKTLQYKEELAKLKKVIVNRMDVESDGLNNLKKELVDVKKENENLRISIATYSQKPGKKETTRLHIYQQAADRLMINAPGFGAAWQTALKQSEDAFNKAFTGEIAFVRKVIPIKTDAQIISDEN